VYIYRTRNVNFYRGLISPTVTLIHSDIHFCRCFFFSAILFHRI